MFFRTGLFRHKSTSSYRAPLFVSKMPSCHCGACISFTVVAEPDGDRDRGSDFWF
jgi:hypothetical protein